MAFGFADSDFNASCTSAPRSRATIRGIGGKQLQSSDTHAILTVRAMGAPVGQTFRLEADKLWTLTFLPGDPSLVDGAAFASDVFVDCPKPIPPKPAPKRTVRPTPKPTAPPAAQPPR
jgi:hypothetical protein